MSVLKESAITQNDEISKDNQSEKTLKSVDNQIVSESYEFEMSEEVRIKIENATDRHRYIKKDSISDLSVLEAPSSLFRFIKRAFDIVVSLGAIIALMPIALIIMLAIYIDDPGRPFFRQYRVGKNGKRFKVYKFRTMRKEAPKYLSTMEVDDPDKYITRLGRFLRKYSIDEFPQLINVLKGDMSLVGPRPLISDEYEIHQMRTVLGIYKIRPGVTGLAQINGRDTVDPETKVRWDHKYVETMGIKTDLKILFATVPKVFGHAGLVEGYSIMSSDNAHADANEQENQEEEPENACV